jgi:hypothetical protein
MDRNQRDGDFERYGRFAGVADRLDTSARLARRAELCDSIPQPTRLKYLSPEIRIAGIGLSENWRRGIKGIVRQ